MVDNLIDEFTKTFSEIYDANHTYIEAAAYWVASSTLGVFTEMVDLKRLSKKPNIYVIFSSIPWAERRSTIVILAGEVYKEAWNEFYKRFTSEEIANDSIIGKGTEQGIVDRVMEKKLDHYDIIEPEMGGHWDMMKHQRHLSGYKSFLTSRYDGHEYIEDLSQRRGKKSEDDSDRRYIAPGTNFTLIGDLQEPEKYFDENDITQGTMRRTLLIYVPKEEIIPENTKSEYSIHSNTREAIKRVGGLFADRMEFLRPIANTKMYPIGEDYILNREIEIRKTLKTCTDPIPHLYKPIEIEMLKKLPVLRTVSSDCDFIGDIDKDIDRFMPVSEETFNESRIFLKKILVNLSAAIDRIMYRRSRPVIMDDEMVKRKIVNDIENHENWVQKITEITGMGRKALSDPLSSLFEEERVFCIETYKKGIGKGRPKKYYTTSKDTYRKHKAELEKDGYLVRRLN